MLIPVLYGTNGGKSAAAAEIIANSLKSIYTTYNTQDHLDKIEFKVAEMNTVDVNRMSEIQIAIFVCSTTGDGACPYNMQRFWREIKRRAWNNSFEQLHFAVVGLGDSSYEKYNYAGKMLYNRLKQVGGTPICARCDCDDMEDAGIYTALYPWIDTLKKELHILLGKFGKFKMNKRFTEWQIEEKKEEQKESITCTLVEKKIIAPYGIIKNLTEIGSIYSEVIDLIFKIHHEKDYEYGPGDVLEIHAENTKYMEFVNEAVIQEKLVLDKNTEIYSRFKYLDYQKVPMHHEVQKIYKRIISGEIKFKACVPDKALFMKKMQSLSESYDEYYTYIVRPQRTTREVLRDFYLQVHTNTDIFTKIFPRYYTISKKEENLYSITAGIVNRYTNLSEARKGVCSEYLKALEIGKRMKIRIRKAVFSMSGSLLMFSTGTGISLPRTTIQAYLCGEMSSVTDITAVIGFRELSSDFLYKEELMPADADIEVMQGRSSYGIRRKIVSADGKRVVTLIVCPSRIKKEIEDGVLQSNLIPSNPQDLPDKNYLIQVLEQLIDVEDLEKQIIISGSTKTSKVLISALNKKAQRKVNVYTECW